MKPIYTGLFVIASCGLVACTNLVDESDAEETTDDVSLDASGNPDKNGVDTFNVAHSQIVTNPSISGPLLGQSLRTGQLNNAVTNAVCTDDRSAEVLKYIVACALPASQSVKVTCGSATKVYAGWSGLASAWGQLGGNCNNSYCREWVSACVLAHSNFTGEAGVDVEIAGSNIALTGAHNLSYPNDEAAYWGDIFTAGGNPSKRFGCSGSNAHSKYLTKQFGSQYLMSRVCGYFGVDDTCQVCNNPYSAKGDACSGSASTPYLSNMNGPTIRSCSALCGIKAGANGGFFNNCNQTGSGSASARVITVWRKP